MSQLHSSEDNLYEHSSACVDYTWLAWAAVVAGPMITRSRRPMRRYVTWVEEEMMAMNGAVVSFHFVVPLDKYFHRERLSTDFREKQRYILI